VTGGGHFAAMRTLVATIAAVLAGYPCMAAADSACIPVRVRTHATNGSAQRLAVLVAKELDRDSRFTRLPEGAPGTLTISLPDQLGWERSLGWTLVSYQARLDAAHGRIQVLKGHCWNWNLRACAQQILSSAAGFSAHNAPYLEHGAAANVIDCKGNIAIRKAVVPAFF
jgi:hypothetical protein